MNFNEDDLLEEIERLKEENRKLREASMKPSSVRNISRQFKADLTKLINSQEDPAEYKYAVVKILSHNLISNVPDEIVSLFVSVNAQLPEEDMQALIKTTLKNLFISPRKSSKSDENAAITTAEVKAEHTSSFKEPFNLFGNTNE